MWGNYKQDSEAHAFGQLPSRIIRDSRASYIRWLQDALNKITGSDLNVHGVKDHRTVNAIKNFQRSRGIAVNGISNPETELEIMNVAGELGYETGVVEGIGLGLAVFQLGVGVATSGHFSVNSTVASYVHQSPSPIPYKSAELDFRIYAWNPRPLTGGWEEFWFKLTYQYNGNDLRVVKVEGLVNKSSSLYSSDFSIRFEPTQYSHPSDPIAEIRFDITGEWNPVGRGDVSLINSKMYVKADGSYPRIFVDSEEEWVTADRFYAIKALVPTAPYIPSTPAPSLPSTPTPSIPAGTSIPSTILRRGAKGELVKRLQRNIANWARRNSQPYILKDDGDFGRNTETAVRAFQRWARLRSVDGIVGSGTWAALAVFN
ncbi:MAG: peptidoglycan-binding protein [Chitinophagaceae bacterium]|nr:peptidoglycan-binding protein [Chitinophagaceae bacterium]